jgi:hypothetical protein
LEQDVEDQIQDSVSKSVDSVSIKSKKENLKQKESNNGYTENYESHENPQTNDVTLPLANTDNALNNLEPISITEENPNTQTSNQSEVIQMANGATNHQQQAETEQNYHQSSIEAAISSTELDKLPSINASEWTPIPKTRIAYKEWTLTENGCPGLSDYKQATVISFTPSTDEITVKLVKSEHNPGHNDDGDEVYDNEADDYDFNRKQRQRVFTEEGFEIEYITVDDKVDQVIWKGNLVELKII